MFLAASSPSAARPRWPRSRCHGKFRRPASGAQSIVRSVPTVRCASSAGRRTRVRHSPYGELRATKDGARRSPWLT